MPKDTKKKVWVDNGTNRPRPGIELHRYQADGETWARVEIFSSVGDRSKEILVNVRDLKPRGEAHTPNARTRPVGNETAARELALFIENDYDLVGAPNSQGKSIEKNLLAKLKKGTFDLGKSEVAWGYLIEAGAKKYAKEFASPGEWSKMFPKPTRDLCASYFAISFYEEYKLGNVG
jgi:hypothetical protein